jgi:hypothetical protein
LKSVSAVVVLVAFCASAPAAPLGSPSTLTPPITLAAAPLFAIPVDLRVYGVPANAPELLLPGTLPERVLTYSDNLEAFPLASIAGAIFCFGIVLGIAWWQQQHPREAHAGVKVRRERRTMAFI